MANMHKHSENTWMIGWIDAGSLVRSFVHSILLQLKARGKLANLFQCLPYFGFLLIKWPLFAMNDYVCTRWWCGHQMLTIEFRLWWKQDDWAKWNQIRSKRHYTYKHTHNNKINSRHVQSLYKNVSITENSLDKAS